MGFFAGKCISACQWCNALTQIHCLTASLFQTCCISNISLLENDAENFSAQETSILKISGWRTTDVLQLQLCKTSVVQALKEHYLVARIRFCTWFLQCVYDGKVDAQFMFFCDETWFSWRGAVNSQNSWYWRVESPGLVHKLPLHDKKVVIRFAMSACHEI